MANMQLFHLLPAYFRFVLPFFYMTIDIGLQFLSHSLSISAITVQINVRQKAHTRKEIIKGSSHDVRMASQ